MLALPNEFVRGLVSRRYDDELRRWAASTGIAGVELVVDPTLQQRPGAADDAGEEDDLDAILLAGPPPDASPFPPGLTTRLLAERGFWSLAPGARSDAFRVDDLRGSLTVEPGRLGTPGTFEAVVFTGLLSLWGGESRTAPVVETSLRNLVATLRMSWSGRTAQQLRDGIERLKTTTYRMTFADESGGRERLFSLLDEIETTWIGPPTTPHRRVRAVFSRTVWAEITQPRILRTVDLEALRAIGHRRELARRLFLFLEAQPGHEIRRGLDLVERVVDERLAATLGCAGPLWRTVSLLRAAGAAICATARRYERVQLVARRKRRLAVGEPRFLLQVVRHRVPSRGRATCMKASKKGASHGDPGHRQPEGRRRQDHPHRAARRRPHPSGPAACCSSTSTRRPTPPTPAAPTRRPASPSATSCSHPSACS